MHVCNFSSQELEVGNGCLRPSLGLQNEFQISLSYRTAYLKIIRIRTAYLKIIIIITIPIMS